jgi:hypothetical protein
MAEFSRFSAIVKPSAGKRVESVSVGLVIKNTLGNVWFTDVQLQGGAALAGYERNAADLAPADKTLHWHNGIVRNGGTAVIFNMGGTSNWLDVYIYPKQGMPAGSIEISQGHGSNKATVLPAVSAGGEAALLASNKTCMVNGAAAGKQGFYQYTAAADSKHPIKLEQKTGAALYFEYRERGQAQA